MKGWLMEETMERNYQGNFEYDIRPLIHENNQRYLKILPRELTFLTLKLR